MAIRKNCPRCYRPMHNLGNVSGGILTSDPPQWDEVWVCHSCRIKMNFRVRQEPLPDRLNTDFLNGYEQVECAENGGTGT